MNDGEDKLDVAAWLETHVSWLFEYALEYMTQTGSHAPSPKLHLVDARERMVTVSLDFWDAGEAHTREDIAELRRVIGRLARACGAVAQVLFFVARRKGRPLACLLAGGRGVETVLHVKPMIRRGRVMDFGPSRRLDLGQARSLVF